VTENIYVKVTKGKDPLLFEKWIFCDLQPVHDDDRRNNQKWTVQRNGHHMVYKTNDKQNKNTTHYVLETTTIKQTQLT